MWHHQKIYLSQYDDDSDEDRDDNEDDTRENTQLSSTPQFLSFSTSAWYDFCTLAK